jgi:SecD/SecF fusion protein
LLDKIIAQGGGPVLGLFSPNTATVNGYFKRQEVRNLLSADQRYVKFLWGKLTIIKGLKIKMLKR